MKTLKQKNKSSAEIFLKFPKSPPPSLHHLNKSCGQTWLNYFPPSSNYLILTTEVIKWSQQPLTDGMQEISQNISKIISSYFSSK